MALSIQHARVLATAVTVCVAPLAQAQSASTPVDRLTELVVQTVPMGKVFDMLAAERGELPWRQPGFEQYWRRARADSFLLHP